MTIAVNQFVIGITGKAGHGKDTVAEAIKKAFGLREQTRYEGPYARAAIYRFADPLKRAYESLFGLPNNSMEEFENKNQLNPFTGTTHRHELQYLGTEAYRDRTGRPDVWIELLAHKVAYQESLDYTIIIPDVRFENEARFVKDNGILIQVVRPESPLETQSSHVSEAGIGNIKPDITLINDGTLQQLIDTAQGLVIGGAIDRIRREYQQVMLQYKVDYFRRRATFFSDDTTKVVDTPEENVAPQESSS